MFIKKIYIMDESILGGPMMAERERPMMDKGVYSKQTTNIKRLRN
jgi:hypothetical protein